MFLHKLSLIQILWLTLTFVIVINSITQTLQPLQEGQICALRKILNSYRGLISNIISMQLVECN